MKVYIIKTVNKDSTAGMFPVGYTAVGTLVNEEGTEIEPDKIQGNVFIKLNNTVFEDRPFQFATDTIQQIKKVLAKFVIETTNSTWEMQKLS